MCQYSIPTALSLRRWMYGGVVWSINGLELFLFYLYENILLWRRQLTIFAPINLPTIYFHWNPSSTNPRIPPKFTKITIIHILVILYLVIHYYTPYSTHSEIQLDKFSRYVRCMEDSVKHLCRTCSKTAHKQRFSVWVVVVRKKIWGKNVWDTKIQEKCTLTNHFIILIF